MDNLSLIRTHGLANYVIQNGGSLHPLIIPASITGGTGLMNPSIFFDSYQNQLLINIRHVNYTLYHSEGMKFNQQFGPLQYLHPENDRKLKTKNFIGTLDEKLQLTDINLVDTSVCDIEPMWEFYGLEDARLFRWNGNIYLCGVRRDTTPTGVGRMELSKIEFTRQSVSETERIRVPAPPPDTSYCEKNWMPIIDQPYSWVKWTNPTEVVRFDTSTRKTTTISLDNTKIYPLIPDQRGGSHVIPWKDYYLALTHEVNLDKTPMHKHKNAIYRHRFILWDRNWNFIKISNAFSFMAADIEFAAGASIFKDDLLISFGFQDNACFVLRMPLILLPTIFDYKI